MLFLKIGPDLVNVGNITWIRMLSRETDELAVHFVGGGAPLEMDSDAGNALLEELVALHDARLLVLRNRARNEAAAELHRGGNGHVRQTTQHNPAPAGGPRLHNPAGGEPAGPGGGLQGPGDGPARADPQPLFAPGQRPAPGERPRRRRAGSRSAVA